MYQKIAYLCSRISVERFVLLATTGKNAKTNPIGKFLP
jgi:hypothetical protein